jgi:threonine dehydrogenase-like Zn-dependent dehydrogenase
LDVVDPNSVRPQWLTHIGGKYVDGRNVPADQIETHFPPLDLIVEATGIADLEFNLLDALGQDGIYVPTGIPGGDRPLQLDGAELMRALVLKNLCMVGSVNAARDHFQMAVEHLFEANLRWPGWIPRLITGRKPLEEYAGALQHHDPDEIKTVIAWGSK